MPISDVLIGSVPNLAAQTIAVTAGGNLENLELAAGSYYVDDHASARSLCLTLAALIETHADVVSCEVFLARNRLVQIVANPAIAIDWTDTEARDVLGFQGNLASDTTHEGDVVSDYIWVPDRPCNAEARKGRHGSPVHDTIVSVSGGTEAHVVATGHDSRVWNAFDFRFVPMVYTDTGTDVGGTWRQFFDTIIRRYRQFKVYEDYTHDEASAVSLGLLASTRLGPYRLRHSGMLDYATFIEREFANIEAQHRVRFPVIQVSEFS